MNAKRKKAEDLIYSVLDTADKTHTNSTYYKQLFSKMSDADFEEFWKRRLPLRFHIKAFEIEPKMHDVVDAFNGLGEVVSHDLGIQNVNDVVRVEQFLSEHAFKAFRSCLEIDGRIVGNGIEDFAVVGRVYVKLGIHVILGDTRQNYLGFHTVICFDGQSIANLNAQVFSGFLGEHGAVTVERYGVVADPFS